jgi:hypothetical protein
MISETRLSSDHTIWVEAQCEAVRGLGTVVPRLIFDLRLRTPRDKVRARVERLYARLSAGGEYLGSTVWFGADEITQHRSSATIELPLSREAWAHLSDLPPTGGSMVLQLDLSGQMQVWHDIDQSEEGHFWPRPERQEWTTVAIDAEEYRIFVPRSEWVSRVVEPIGGTEILVFELENSAVNASRLRKAFDHLQRARRHYAEGHDAEAAGACYSALEALPGAPKEVVSSIGDPDKRQNVDALIKAVKAYCHAGRHVSKVDEMAGSFAAEHIDARFAIGLTTVLLAHVGAIR